MSIKDSIRVHGIQTYTKIGVADNERQIGQNLTVDLEVFLDLTKAGQSDSLDDTVSYVELSKKVQSVSQKKDFKLLEHFASNIVNEIFTGFSAIQAISVTIQKPHIPNPEFKGRSSISIYRERVA